MQLVLLVNDEEIVFFIGSLTESLIGVYYSSTYGRLEQCRISADGWSRATPWKAPKWLATFFTSLPQTSFSMSNIFMRNWCGSRCFKAERRATTTLSSFYWVLLTLSPCINVVPTQISSFFWPAHLQHLLRRHLQLRLQPPFRRVRSRLRPPHQYPPTIQIYKTDRDHVNSV